jgi:GNAT superfamily N-acetyltransferase
MTSDDIHIRTATDADLPHLGDLGAALVRQHHEFDSRRFISPPDPESAYGEFLRRQMRSPDAVILVAQQGPSLVGYVFASIEPASMKELRDTAGFIHDLFVSESRRGDAIGTRLVEAAATWLREQGAVRVMLWSAEKNTGAQRLFEM